MTQNELFCPYSLLLGPLLSCFRLSSAAMPGFLQCFQFFLHCCLCILYFHGFRHWNRFVHKIVVTQSIHAFSFDVVFMVLALRPFHAYPQRFVGLNNTNTFRLVLSNCVKGWHRNFQLSMGIFDFTLEFSIIRFNKENTT